MRAHNGGIEALVNKDVAAWPLYLAKMTSSEIEKVVERVKIVLLPVGSIEQHGIHLPIDTDWATSEYLAREGVLAARSASGQPTALIAPGMPFGGPGLAMDGWPGTITLRPEVFIDVIIDIGHSVADMGFSVMVMLNGCFGNNAAMTLAAQKLKGLIPEKHFILLDSFWAMPEIIRELRETEPGGIGHAGEIETSIQLAIDPQHVHLELSRSERMKHPSPSISFDSDEPWPFQWAIPFRELTQSGVIGDPTVASAEKGQAVLKANVERISRALRHIHGLV
jgi:creatinine amidohydrolase